MRRTPSRKPRSAKTRARRAVASVNAGTRQLRKSRQLAAASAETILHRAALMNQALQTGDVHHREFSRMGSEKIDAMVDSWRAMGMKTPAMNFLLMQHWGRWVQRSMASAVAMANARSSSAAAAVAFRATTAMLGDMASLNQGLLRFSQGLSAAATVPLLRVAAANARRLSRARNAERS